MADAAAGRDWEAVEGPRRPADGVGAKEKRHGGGLLKEGLLWKAPNAPYTRWRPIHTEDLGSFLPMPHVPRAEVAADREHPEGSRNHETRGMSVLQQHCAFFDRNGDGIVYPWETFQGFRAVGFNALLSLAAAVVINVAFSWYTLDGWLPSLLFPIYIKNVHRAKHGSDSEIYDTEGRFVPAKFEELFSKYDHGDKGGLFFLELLEMTEANRNAMDWFGWSAAKLEWGMTYLLCHDDRGIVPKESIRGVFDGSFFEYMENSLYAHPHAY